MESEAGRLTVSRPLLFWEFRAAKQVNRGSADQYSG